MLVPRPPHSSPMLLGSVLFKSLESLGIIPRHPRGWIAGYLIGMPLQCVEVIGGIDVVETTRVDDGHENVADAGAVFRLIKV